MANTLKIKRSAVASKVPLVGDLQLGELAVNTYDGKLFLKKDNGTASIVEIGAGGGGGATVTQSLSTSPPSSPTAGNLWWQTDTGSLKIYYTDANTSQWVDASPGAAGPAGSAATISVGTVTELLPVDTPTVTNGGTSSAAVLNFGIPRAPAIALGTIGVLNPNQNPTVSTSGVDGDKQFNFSLPRASAISVGTTTTGSAGSSASVTNSGTNGDTVLNFTVPRGDTGATGPMGPKSILLQYPTTADTKIVMFYTTAALTLSKIMAVLPGGTSTPSLTYNVRYGSDVSATGTAVTTLANTVTNVSTGTAITTFSNGTISAGSFVWVEVTVISGSIPALSLTLEF